MTALPPLFARFRVLPSTAEALFRALEEYQTGLESMALPEGVELAELPEGALHEAIGAHEEIKLAFAAAAEHGGLPPYVAEILLDVLEQFAIGLLTLGTPSVPVRA